MAEAMSFADGPCSLRPSISSWRLPSLNSTVWRVASFYTHLICRWNIFLLIARSAAVDAIVSDRATIGIETPGVQSFIHCDERIVPRVCDRNAPRQTGVENSLTSGTTGTPKLVVHTLTSLAGAIEKNDLAPARVSLEHILRYPALRIRNYRFFFAPCSPAHRWFYRARRSRWVSFWLPCRRTWSDAHFWNTVALAAEHPDGALRLHLMAPEYPGCQERLLTRHSLTSFSRSAPKARVSHAFASTEAGVAFDVKDTMSGVPSAMIQHTHGVEMKIEHRTLRIRSDRTASRNLNHECRPLKGWAASSSADMLELRGDRSHSSVAAMV